MRDRLLMTLVSRAHSCVENMAVWTISELEMMTFEVVFHFGLLSCVDGFCEWNFWQKLIDVLCDIASLSLAISKFDTCIFKI